MALLLSLLLFGVAVSQRAQCSGIYNSDGNCVNSTTGLVCNAYQLAWNCSSSADDLSNCLCRDLPPCTAIFEKAGGICWDENGKACASGFMSQLCTWSDDNNFQCVCLAHAPLCNGVQGPGAYCLNRDSGHVCGVGVDTSICVEQPSLSCYCTGVMSQPPSAGRHTFVFIYLSFLLISLIPALVLAALIAARWQKILLTHNTLSSYCADATSNGHANRALLAVTCLIAGALSGLLIEEYNSRTPHDMRLWLELSSALALPLVGLFPTSGAFDQKQKYFCAINCIRVPIGVSELIHSVAALYFLFVNGVLNMTYVLNLLALATAKDIPFSAIARFLFAMAVLSLLLLSLFLLAQGLIYGLRLRRSCSTSERQASRAAKVERVTLLTELDHDAPLEIECSNCQSQQLPKRLCSDCGTLFDGHDHSRRFSDAPKWLYGLSFLFEVGVILAVLLCTILSSLKRNTLLDFL